MRVERRPVDVIVAAVNVLKVKSCWIDAPDVKTGGSLLASPGFRTIQVCPPDLSPTPAAG
jgi:hypothetical protein